MKPLMLQRFGPRLTAAGALAVTFAMSVRSGPDGDQQPVGTDLADRTLDRLFVGAHNPLPSWTTGSEVGGQSLHDRPGRVGKATVAEDHGAMEAKRSSCR